MKQLIRRLSQIADSSSESPFCNQIRLRDVNQPRARANAPSWIFKVRRATIASSVPSGLVPVNVGEEMERFVVSAELLNHPVFIGLLNRSAQEYGYAQKGVLHIPCNVFVFEKVVAILRSGMHEFSDIPELVVSLSAENELFLTE